MKRDLGFTVSPAEAGLRLDDWLLDHLAAQAAADSGPAAAALVSKSKVRRLVMSGALMVDGRPVRFASLTLAAGQRLAVAWELERFLAEKDPGDIDFELSTAGIVYEDDWLIAVDKPAGLPTEPTMVAGRDHLQAAVVRFLAGRDGLADPPVYIHHRLDRDTSGVIVFSKRKEANAGLHAAFEKHLAQKTYLAICRRPARLPGPEFRVENRLGRISPKSRAAKWGAVPQGGDPAYTDFSLRRTGAAGLLVEARPRTGRTHQIRVHLAGLGLPLWGDPLYGGPERIGGMPVPRVMLHALRLELPHPVTGARLVLEAPPPADFRDCMELLESIPGASRPGNSPRHPRQAGRSPRRPH
jgi:23S rRNA pseudouridine1911/1915/1917 synthase